jgi:hypothetical protein
MMRMQEQAEVKPYPASHVVGMKAKLGLQGVTSTHAPMPNVGRNMHYDGMFRQTTVAQGLSYQCSGLKRQDSGPTEHKRCLSPRYQTIENKIRYRTNAASPRTLR